MTITPQHFAFGWETYAMMAQLRVFSPSEPPPVEDPITLRRIWEQHVLPRKRREGMTGRQEGFYLRALRRWEAFASVYTDGGPDRLHDRQTVSWIDEDALLAHQDFLISLGEFGARTVNVDQTCIGTILKGAVRQRLLPMLPDMPAKLDEGDPDPVQLTYEELDALYDACEIATWPSHSGRQPDDKPRYALPYSAADGWRFALVWFCNYGFRPGELIAQLPDAEPVTWANVSLKPGSPAPNGKAQCEHGWFWYTPAKQRRKKPRPLILPMNRATRAHLDVLRVHGVERLRPLLDWPGGGKQMREQWLAIVEAAGVELKPDLKTGEAGKVHLRFLRSTCSSWLDEHEPGISPYIVGHARDRNPQTNLLVRGGTKVSGRHYVRMENAVVEALTTFPQPAAFSKSIEADRPF